MEAIDRTARRSLVLDLVVTDPEVLDALEPLDLDQREEVALTALRVGMLALRHARGDAAALSVREEGDRLLDSLREVLANEQARLVERVSNLVGRVFDPESGEFTRQVERLVAHDGDLAGLLGQILGADDTLLARTLARHVGEGSPLLKVLDPKQKDGLVDLLSRTVQEALAEQRRVVLSEFSLDRADSALSRLVRQIGDGNGKLRAEFAKDVESLRKQFSFDEEGSALNRLVGSVEEAQRRIVAEFSLDADTSALSRLGRELRVRLDAFDKKQAEFQAEVMARLAAQEARQDEATRGTRHGLEFEAALAGWLDAKARACGDVVEAVGDRVGQVKNCKVGDVVWTLGPDRVGAGRKIAFEAKQVQGFTRAKALDEIASARKNRGAEIGVFVFSARSAPEGLEPFDRVGDDLLVVWDADDASSDVWLRAAVFVATALAAKAGAEARVAVDLDAFARSIHAVQQEAARAARITKGCAEMRRHLDGVEDEARKLGDVLVREAKRLDAALKELREGLNGEED